MNARERLSLTLAHRPPDRVPLDLGATPVSGMHVSMVYQLRQALALDPPGTPVRVTNITQMLGEIAPDLAEALGVDTLPLERPVQSFGIANTDWKEWRTFDDTPVLVPGGFNTRLEPNGDLLMYPQGDFTAPPSGRMPSGGYYFDALVRQPPLDESRLDPADNLEEFGLLSDAELAYYAAEAERLFMQTDKALVGNPGGTGFGDIAQVPAVQLAYPRGIRDLEEWYMSLAMRPDYIAEVFAGQCEVALQNLARFYEAVGEKIAVIFLSGTDFGGQNSLLFSPRTYRRLFKPNQKRLNDWVHANTGWKTMIHTDGAMWDLIPDLIEAGFDILNPVQFSATGMDPERLKSTFGEQITFWGAGVDTQKTLPFGTPDEVRAEVGQMLATFRPGGGFVFAGVHNIQAGVPLENLLAFFEAFQAGRAY
ncbi:MAG TPA: uroporphyrinogen decarboxylase family protein [Anaerolineales bacterium]|nr:uroporphyrinogen decarboxylase family protein [Anaerolineales bacterium]